MFRQIFNPDNLFWQIISRGVDFIGLSLFWALLSLPIVTIGPACASLYYTSVKVFRQKEEGAFGIILRTFISNLKLGIPVTIICELVFVLLGCGYLIMKASAVSSVGIIMYVAYYIAMIVPIGIIVYLFPIMARFKHNLKSLFFTSTQMAISHLPSTLVLVLLTVEFIVFTMNHWIAIAVTPMLYTIISSLFLERIFEKHLSLEERAALNNRTAEEQLEAEKSKEKKSTQGSEQ